MCAPNMQLDGLARIITPHQSITPGFSIQTLRGVIEQKSTVALSKPTFKRHILNNLFAK